MRCEYAGPMSMPSTHKNPLTLAKEKLAAAQAAEEAARAAAKLAKKADKQAAKESEKQAEKSAKDAAKPGKPGKKAPPRVEVLRAAPPVIDPEVDDEGIDPDEESEEEFIEDTEGGDEEDAEFDPGDDDDDQEGDEEDVGDDTGEDSDPAPKQSAGAPTEKRGRGKRGPGKPVDPRIAQILGEIDNAQTRRVSINVCKRVLPLVFSYEDQFSKVSKSAEREKVLAALKDLVGAVECFVGEMRAVRQDWVARRGTAKPGVVPGTLVRLTEKALPEFGEFLPEDGYGKLVDIKPGKKGRVLYEGRHILLPLAALDPADD